MQQSLVCSDVRSVSRARLVLVLLNSGHSSFLLSSIQEFICNQEFFAGVILVGLSPMQDLAPIASQLTCPVEQSGSNLAAALVASRNFASGAGANAILILDASLVFSGQVVLRLITEFERTAVKGIVGAQIEVHGVARNWILAGYVWDSLGMTWQPMSWLEWGHSSVDLVPVGCPNLGAVILPVTAFEAVGDLDAKLPVGQAFADWCERANQAGFPSHIDMTARFVSAVDQSVGAPEQDAYAVAAGRLAWATRDRAQWRCYLAALWRIALDIRGTQRLPWSQLNWRSPRSAYWAISGHIQRLWARLKDADNHARLAAVLDFFRYTSERRG